MIEVEMFMFCGLGIAPILVRSGALLDIIVYMYTHERKVIIIII
jgi:hypothetical protein